MAKTLDERSGQPALEQQVQASACGEVTAGGTPPRTNAELIFEVWKSLTWSRTGQVSLLIAVFGATVMLTSWGLSHLAQALFGTSTVWSAVGGVAAGTGVSAVTRRVARSRAGSRRSR